MLQFVETTRLYSLDNFDQFKGDINTNEGPFLVKLDFSGRYVYEFKTSIVLELVTLLINISKRVEYLDLDLRYGDICDDDIKALNKFLRSPNCPAIISLDLRHNQITDTHAAMLLTELELIQQVKIRLNLGHNLLNDQTALAFAELLNHHNCP